MMQYLKFSFMACIYERRKGAKEEWKERVGWVGGAGGVSGVNRL